MNNRLVIINNKYHIVGFTLNVFQDSTLKIDLLTPSAPQTNIQKMEYKHTITARNYCLIKPQYDIYERDNYFLVDNSFNPPEGFIEIEYDNDEVSVPVHDSLPVQISIKYQVVADEKQAHECEAFYNKLGELLKETDMLNEPDLYQYRINHFIQPHISGVKHDLELLDTSFQASYSIGQDNRIEIKGTSNKSIMKYALNNQINEMDQISLHVRLNDVLVDIIWDNNGEFWFIKNKADKIPAVGTISIDPNEMNDDQYNNQANALHNRKKLDLMRSAMEGLKIDNKYTGRKIISSILNGTDFSKLQKSKQTLNENLSGKDSIQNQTLNVKLSGKDSIQNQTLNEKDIKKLLLEYNLLDLYDKMDGDQKGCILEAIKSSVLIINGEGGTGKTQVGALIAMIFGLLGKRTLITSETNSAVENIYNRIEKFQQTSNNLVNNLNIIRILSKQQQFMAPSNQNSLESQSSKLIAQIKDVTIDDSSKNEPTRNDYTRKDSIRNEAEKKLKIEFRETFQRSEIIERLIIITYDIIHTTYGTLVENKSLNNLSQDYDINIVEASSSINFSSFILSGLHAAKWIFLYDENQLNPQTAGDFLLRQPIRFPTSSELANMRRYNPYGHNINTAKLLLNTNLYRQNVVDVLLNNKLVSDEDLDSRQTKKNIIYKKNLTNQYRIHPKLFGKIKKAYNSASVCVTNKEFIELKQFSPLFDNVNHFKFKNIKTEDLLIQMGKDIADLADKLNQNYTESFLTIGITCTDIDSLNIVFEEYQKSCKTKSLHQDNRRNIHLILYRGFTIRFSSIKVHQEWEYDLYFIGIINHESKEFGKRLYTALTRASNYAVVYCELDKRSYSTRKTKSTENVRMSHQNDRMSHQQINDKNMEIIRSLAEE